MTLQSLPSKLTRAAKVVLAYLTGFVLTCVLIILMLGYSLYYLLTYRKKQKMTLQQSHSALLQLISEMQAKLFMWDVSKDPEYLEDLDRKACSFFLLSKEFQAQAQVKTQSEAVRDRGSSEDRVVGGNVLEFRRKK